MDDMETPTSRALRKLMKEHDINATDLSRATGVPQPTISRILSAKILSPTDEKLRPIAEYFQVTTDQLRGRSAIDPRNRAADPVQSANGRIDMIPISVWTDDTPLGDDEVEILFLKEVEVAAGNGRTVVQESSERRLRFGSRSLRNQGIDPASAVCITVSGNSMEPVLRHKATIAVDRSRRSVTDGDIYAIDHAGQIRVKQLYRVPGGGVRLHSFNTEEHPDEIYTLEEMRAQEIKVLGRVFWSASYF